MDLTKGILRTLSGSEEYKMFLISFSKESEQKVDYSHYKREYNYRARKNKDKTFFFVISLPHFLLPSLFYNHY